MSLGLPSHLARGANSRALASAGTWAALVCLGAALVTVFASSFGSGGPYSWVTVVALMPMVALLILLARHRTVLLMLAYLFVGSLCTYFYVLTLLTQTPAYHDTNLFVVALPVVAMTLVGGTGVGSLAGVLWATLGFALAEVAAVFAAVTAGREFLPEAISLGSYLLLVGLLIFDGLTRNIRTRPQSRLHRSVRDARLTELRRELLADSATELHDTVLSELLALASAPPGPLDARLQARIEGDLRRLWAGSALPTQDEDEQAPGSPDGQSPSPADIWFASELHRAVELARDEGLSVDVSGDRDVLADLTPAVRESLGLAVRQCLVNVMRHSGSATAEVALGSSPDAVSVMVVDAGSGFEPSATAADRMGLRNSVHERMERVGGSATIYSSAGVGTTVLLMVPRSSASASAEGGGDGTLDTGEVS